MLNELLFVLVMFLSMLLVLVFSRLGKAWLMIVPPVLLILANIFAPQINLVFGIATSLALPIYAVIFLATDVIAEHYGKKEARKVIWMGFATQLLLAIISQIIIRVQVVEFSQPLNDALRTIFGFTPRIVLGSFIAYLISQNYDVWVFHFLKKKFRGKYLWLRNNISTITSQLIDSVIFILIAFLGVFPNVLAFIFGVWFLKVVVAAIDTPFIYLSYRFLKKSEPKQKHLHFPHD